MYEFIYYEVKDVMTSEPITVDQQATMAEIETIFEKHTFNGIPVVDDRNRLKGMITKFDLLEAFALRKRIKPPNYNTIMLQPASLVMKQKLHIFGPKTPLTRVLQKMIETRHKSFPVVKRERVVGIIAREDMLRALRKSEQGQLPTRMTSTDMEVVYG